MNDSSGSHSVTRYLSGLARGNQEAISRIWERYFGQVLRLARRKLRSCPPFPLAGQGARSLLAGQGVR